MRDSYTAKEIASALEVDVTTVRRRALGEGWETVGPRQGLGGVKPFDASSLPTDVRLALQKRESRAVAKNTVVPASPAARRRHLAEVSEKKRSIACAKCDVVQLYTDAVAQAPWGQKDVAREQFMAAYHYRAWPELYATLGEISSWKTLEKWKKRMEREGGTRALIDHRGFVQRERTLLTPEHQDILVQQALHPNRPSIASIIRFARKVFAAKGMNETPSDRTMRRYLESWSSLNFGTWIFMREGEKSWKDKATFFIERDYDKLEVGQIAVADGHKLNFEIIDHETGRPSRMEMVLWYDMKSNYPLGWEIMPSENRFCIASAFRRACIRLGRYPDIAYLDNGKAFKSKYFTDIDMRQTGLGGLFAELGVQTVFAWPYNAQAKTVERFFQAFAELERFVPSYTGTSIGTKPPRLHRNEVLHKRLYDAAGGRPLTIEEAHVAIAWWFDEYVQRPQQDGHLKGQRPQDVFEAGRGPGVDVEKLDHLMLATERRTIGRNGVRFLNENYYAPELYSRRHPVVIRYDLQDLEKVRVYKDDGEFICEAHKVGKVHPAAHILGDDADKARLEAAIQHKRQQRKDATRSAREFLESVVLPETQERMARMEVKRNEELQASEPLPELPEQTEERVAEIQQEFLRRQAQRPAYMPPEKNREIRTSLDKYDYLFRLRERDQIVLREQDQTWMERYEQTDEFRMAVGERYVKLTALWEMQRKQAASG